MKVTLENVESLSKEAIKRIEKVVPKKIIEKSKMMEYTFKLTRKQGVAGTCYYDKPIIEISTQSVRNDTEEGLANTITHELFHAIFKGHGHRGDWKKYTEKYNRIKEFTDITGKITRCYSSAALVNSDNIHKFNFVLTCPDCGYELYKTRKSKYYNLKTGITEYRHKGCIHNMTVTKL